MSATTAPNYASPRILWHGGGESVASWYDQKPSQPGSARNQRRERNLRPFEEGSGLPCSEWVPILRFKGRVPLSGSWAGGGLAGTVLEPEPPGSPVRRGGSRFTPLSLKEMADLPPPEWLIEGLVPQEA